MTPEPKTYTADLGTRSLVFQTGQLAGQAGGAVTVTCGEAQILGVATMDNQPREGIDFLPLTVDYEERMYAGGTIPGSFFRREGRPTEDAILTARLTDRPIRPLFPKDLRNAIQVIMYSFSADGENPLDILAINAASAALALSDIPWDGPIGAVRIGLIDGQFVLNPTFAEMEISDLDLRLAGTRDAVLMVECGANEVSEEKIIEAVEFGHKALLPIIETIEEMQRQVGKPKRSYTPFAVDEDLKQRVIARAQSPLEELLERALPKAEMKAALDALKEELITEFAGEDESLARDVKQAFETAYKAVVRARILEKGLRPDGRGLKDVRPVWCAVGTSPRAHGTGLFTRGETQVMTLATLGTPRDAQMLDNLTPIETKRYIHHYNFPPFCTGEVRPLRGASRREIGHGALAERALKPMIPSEKEFPYTLRLVSEVLSSNGSSSMASVCGSTLALMDTGVPIKAPVSGVAMGLIKEGERYVILTDIQGVEDHLGDMDFKVAGTPKGITALQMDIKIKGITPQIMREALAQAKEARAFILDKMLEVIPEPRKELKPHVPRITTIQIPEDKIGVVIGPGGKTIRAIQDETGAQIDIQEDGTVFIATADAESARKARERIERLTESPEVGRIYTGKVTGIKDFGAFVEIIPGTDGMVHISQLDTRRVEHVEDVVKKGDEITVMLTEIDENGKLRLSRRAVLEGWTVEEALENDRAGKKSGGRRRGGSSERRGGGGGGRRHRR
ncbi:MAG: polyribonucleotide nucleotidyltransferase [Anaerolineae bacterium]|nr:MAG: polyribonucleotide nucleotidyltransferase [Anaerolineae bacterium]